MVEKYIKVVAKIEKYQDKNKNEFFNVTLCALINPLLNQIAEELNITFNILGDKYPKYKYSEFYEEPNPYFVSKIDFNCDDMEQCIKIINKIKYEVKNEIEKLEKEVLFLID